MLKERKFNVVKVGPDAPASFDARPAGKLVDYDGHAVSVKL